MQTGQKAGQNTDGTGSAEALERVLREAAGRVRIRRGVAALATGALWGGGGALLLLAFAKLTVVPVWVAWLAPLLVLAGAGSAFLLAWSRRTTPEDMAALLDLRYGLHERITTGWEIARRGPRDAMEIRALELAVESARRASSREVVPVRAPRNAPAGIGALLLPVVLALLLPSWVPPILAQKRAEEAQVKKAGEALEKEVAALATPTPTPTPAPGATGTPTPAPVPTPDAAEPTEKLKKLAEDMKEGAVGKRAAMRELSDLDKELARKQAQAARSEAARALARAASGLEEKEAGKGLGQALAEGDAEKIRKEQQALEKQFDAGEFEQNEQRSLAEDLDALAEALEAGGDPQAASELRKAAEALRSGDGDAAKEHLEKADLAAAAQGAREADPVFEMAQELKKNADTREAGKQLDRGSPQGTSESLEKLAERLEKGELGKEGEKKLQETLAEAAQKGQAQGQDTPGGRMSQPLESAAKSLEKGNRDGAAEALRNLSRAMENAAQQARKNGQARQAVARARARMSGQSPGSVRQMQWDQFGQGQGEGQGQGQGEGEGEGEGGGKGNGKNGGRKEASGSRQSGTEAGSGTSKFQDQGFDAADGPQLDRQSDRKTDWRKEYEQAYKAARTDAAKLGDTKLTGKMGEGETQYIETEGTPERGEAREGFVDLPAGYRDAAEEAVGNEDIPPEHRERVKSYFESLSGTGGDGKPQDGKKE